MAVVVKQQEDWCNDPTHLLNTCFYARLVSTDLFESILYRRTSVCACGTLSGEFCRQFWPAGWAAGRICRRRTKSAACISMGDMWRCRTMQRRRSNVVHDRAQDRKRWVVQVDPLLPAMLEQHHEHVRTYGEAVGSKKMLIVRLSSRYPAVLA